MKRKFFRVLLSVVLALSLCLVMTVPVSAASMTVTVTPANNMAGAITTYPMEFTTVTPYVIDSVEIEFASGFGVSGATLGTVSGIGAGTIGVSGQVVTYTVTAPAHLGAVPVAISLSGIVNPAAATYPTGVTVRTKSGVATIDSGSVSVEIVSAPVSFKVETGNTLSETAGTPFTVTVTAMSQAAGAGDKVDGYIDDHLIDFSSTASDPKILPAFAVIDFSAGVGTLTGVVLNKAETGKTITATDSVISVTGTSGDITVGPGAAHHLTISGAPASVTAGVAFVSSVIVTAYDAGGNVRTAETEVVNWTSSDGTATAGTGLPADSTNLANGTYAFPAADFILKTVGAVAGAQTITATGQTSHLSVTATVTVNPAAASTLTVSRSPTSIAADGVASSVITATAKDAFTNKDTNYAGSVTFATSLGTLSGVSANFVAGVATATLTSTTTGTATILVSSGALTDVTTTVTLTAAPIEVWVKATTGNDNNPGTEALPFLTIAKGITEAGVGGTVNVGPGTYVISTTIDLDQAGLTLQATGTAAETILDASVIAIDITAVDVIVDGFTIEATGIGIRVVTSDDATVINNIITGDPWQTGIIIGADGATVSGNELDINCTMWVTGSLGTTLSDNTFGAGINLAGTTSELTITGNDLTGSEYEGINFDPDGTYDDILIENNIISEVTEGDVIGICVRGTITNLRITGNDITDNEGDGIRIIATVTWGAGNTISNNNISGNLGLGIDNLITGTIPIIDAENNWWGDASGPYHTTNSTASGDAVSNNVDYRPWLTSAYGVEEVTTIDLEVGWNFISVPKSMAAATDTFGELLDGITVTVAYSYDPVSGWSTAKVDADPVEVLEGYWIQVATAGAGTITLSYKEAAQEVPASKSLVGDAWNAIGFSRTTALDADTALMSVYGSWSTILGWDAEGQAYEDSIIVGTTGNMLPGKGYWIWMTEDDVLSAISG